MERTKLAVIVVSVHFAGVWWHNRSRDEGGDLIAGTRGVMSGGFVVL